MPSQYTYVCRCGTPFQVLTSAIGDRMTCRCGRSFTVPALLRTTEQNIQRLVETRELPTNNVCPFTGEYPDASLEIRVTREPLKPSWFRDYVFRWVSALLGVPNIYGPVAEQEEIDASDQGSRQIESAFCDCPIRVSQTLFNRRTQLSSEDLERGLREQPLYSMLLDEYGEFSCATK